jgi:hypothetical protein
VRAPQLLTGLRGVVLPLLLFAAPPQARSFTYAGIGLGSDFKAVAARHPHSTPQGEYVRLEPEDMHDHISGIGISGTGPGRRVRIAFETMGPKDRPVYPKCGEIEAALAKAYGPAGEIRRFSEEASPRADRIWRSTAEEMTLMCFKQHGVLWAEAVQITRR